MDKALIWSDILRVRQKIEIIVPFDRRNRITRAVKIASDGAAYISCLSMIEEINNESFAIYSAI